jgi:hypothetical protein
VEDFKKTQISMLVRFLEIVEGEVDRLFDEEKSKVEGGCFPTNFSLPPVSRGAFWM